MAPLRSTVFIVSFMAVSVAAIDHDDTISKVLADYGILVEEHTIVTDDGYILRAFRLPRPGASVVLQQHGITESAWCWIDNSPEISPAIQVYNMGYDVWLTNNRGNSFSRQHENLSIHSKAFWDFSFSDLARHDVPANIKYVLNTTGKDKLTYMGHSQGTSQFFTAMVIPETKAFVEKTVNLFIAVAPVVYLSHQSATLLRVLVDFHLGASVEAAYPYGFLDWDDLGAISDFLCVATDDVLCKISVDAICGTSNEDTNAALTNMSAHYPAGTSVKSLNHYEQLINSGKFCDYDYGTKGNEEHYGWDSPPDFDLSEAKVPTALFIGSHDDLGDIVDAKRAQEELPNSTLVYSRVFTDYSHVTWMIGSWAAFQAWFSDVQTLLQKYNPTRDTVV